ncbi:MAG: transposase [SAR324 cluster bacterium]|nr:transposase [SAR324 cluster bacterium]
MLNALEEGDETLLNLWVRKTPLWSAPRVHGELRMLGSEVSQTAVAKYMERHRGPPSQKWRTFLHDHAKDLVSIDLFTVPTATFRIVYVFLVLSHERRQVIHINVTEHPTSRWMGQQVVEAFPWEEAPRNLLRDRDKVYGARFHSLDV